MTAWTPERIGRLANISGSEAVKVFGRVGWEVVGQVGSYVVMSKAAIRANLSIPQHKELSIGTLRAPIEFVPTKDPFWKN